ncbi:potassium-transporting p-type ATPase d chain [Paenibacillus mucilaginosus 3016]|uniref:Potassium-transporting P-type ATPase d chain n=1 Tax=Paenibacillus mucilaginosus 3016 TaxID=1116391 RepID=H6NGY0_9BACL|nr:histidine kinase [Paenibacillus mucilaginosus]AFC28422.1 potassium-transporting p-type ATPase d chain [Paenibacillus mucilaginosus 3016]WFA17219.1 histidine kinase [Paenibacillus mucilaginosus]
MDEFRRKTPEEILKSISELQRGRLKIYVGPFSGSGKTYHMLQEGNSLKQRGIDVVICAVSTMQRKETIEQIGCLERVPSIHWVKDGVEKKDLNIEALLARNPEVVLVDGLAHRNRMEARFRTRLQDIQHLLKQGISVITTVNVYELEGYTELAQRLTGIEVDETVPADTLELADEIRLIDVTPESILARLSEGAMEATHTSLSKRDNLGKLRELALRLVAEDVNESLEEHREALGLNGPSGASERILVSTQYHWNGSIYIRRGEQIARRLNGDMLVVTFVDPKKPLSKEQTAFKRSIVKLTEKLEVSFDELPFVRRRAMPRQLVDYAIDNKVTRIVLGHSKQTTWQEWWRGSVVNTLMKLARHVDLFYMADSAEQKGERILPTSITKKADANIYKRLSGSEVKERIIRIKRGTFKIYIGAAPGVGKTYTMLKEGNILLKKGIDVVIGLLETHGRKETFEQIGDLTTIPRQVSDYRGTRLEEMNMEAIIRLNPEVVLVDELAHTNVPGSKNKKRYEDILEILEAGISVISTMNVQHVESLNDAVEQLTGVRVRETVPDRILRLADEVQLIDVAPNALQQRLRDGKIYARNKVEQALNHFFKTGNLIALRELALREIADDVDERLEAWERRDSLRGPWRREEVIFVCVTLSPRAESLIRRGFRIAHRLKADWVVHYIAVKADLPEEQQKRIMDLRELTQRLGGIFNMQVMERRRQVAVKLLEQANVNKSTQLIIGQSQMKFWERMLYGNTVKTILKYGRHMDVLVVSGFVPKER